MEKIRKSVCREAFTCRDRGLFAFLSYSGGGAVAVRGDSAPDGDLGMVVCPVRIPEDAAVEGVVSEGDILSYRDLKRMYERLRDDAAAKAFVDFFETGLGLVCVDCKASGHLVPDKVWLSETRDMYAEMVALSRRARVRCGGEMPVSAKDAAARYEDMGGDEMLEFLAGCMAAAASVAERYLGYAVPDAPVLSFDMFFGESVSDVGYREMPLPGGGEGGESGTVNARAGSRLYSLRRADGFVDECGDSSEPGHGEDWLFYYRIGAMADCNVRVDGDGNIALLDPDEGRAPDGREDNLDAFGTVLSDIRRDKDERTVTFEYYDAAHLVADVVSAEADELGVVHYSYGPFSVDASRYGVRYTETYRYEKDGDIDRLNDNEFSRYVNGEEVLDEHDGGAGGLSKYVKGVMSTGGYMPEDSIGRGSGGDTVVADIEYVRARAGESPEAVPSVPRDYMANVSFRPSVESLVFVDRGNAGFNERHMRLAEARGVDDLERSQAGSFFRSIGF